MTGLSLVLKNLCLSYVPVNAGFILENSSFVSLHTRNLPYLNFVLRKAECWLCMSEVM